MQDLPNSDQFDVIYRGNSYDEWLQHRREANGIGSSDVATIMGLNPWTSAFTLWHERKGIVERPQNDAMRWGQRLEGVVGDAYCEATGRRKLNDEYLLLRSKNDPLMLASPDVLLATDPIGLLEVKTGSQYQADAWAEGAPAYYQCQAQHQLMVTGFSYAALCCLIGGQSFVYTKDYPAHERFQRALRKKAHDFVESLKLDECPYVDDSVSTTNTMRKLRENGRLVDLPDEVLEWHRERQAAADDEKEARKRKEDFQRRIEAVMGSASFGRLPDGTFYKFQTRSQAEKVIPAWSKRVLSHVKRLPKKVLAGLE